MANAIPLGATSQAGAARRTHWGKHRQTASDFGAIVRRSLQKQGAAIPANANPSGSEPAGLAGTLAVQGPSGQGNTSPRATAPGAISGSISAAVDKAMSLEGVPNSWKNSLNYIMAQESGGNVGVQNPRDSARGLFQLTAANYQYNPNGAASFGNAVQEVQGGIRYIKDRYGTAENAVQFWQNHHWY